MAIPLQRSTTAGFLTYEAIWIKIQALIDDDDSEVLVVVKHVINLVYNEIMARYYDSQNPPQWLIDSDDALSTTASQRTNTLNTPDKDPDRILKVSIQANSAWYPCNPILLSDLEENPDRFFNTASTQRPRWYFHRKNYPVSGGEENFLDWFFLPDDSYTFRYWFTKRIPELTQDGDVPQLPKWAHPTLIYGTLVQLAMFDIKVKVGPWAELYERLLVRLDNWSSNFVTNYQERPLRGTLRQDYEYR